LLSATLMLGTSHRLNDVSESTYCCRHPFASLLELWSIAVLQQ